MRAVRMVAAGRPLELQDIPVPEPGDGEVLVRIRAAGICHSDVHYRDGLSPMPTLPLTLGHEIAGVVEAVGARVADRRAGDRVCVHYLLTCGACPACHAGDEQFCREGSMLGHYADGGFAEFIAVPERNAVLLPDGIPFEHGAVLMCSSATALHALRRSGLRAGETVAVFGAGGLGLSAVQLAGALGALEVYAVDINPDKLRLAERYGAIPVDARADDPAAAIHRLTGGRGADVALELIGLPLTMKQAVQSLGIKGRAVIAGLSREPLVIDTYRELLGKEAAVLGSNDHLLAELPLLLELARRGRLDLAPVVSRTVPLDAAAINDVLDELARFGGGVRTVVVP